MNVNARTSVTPAKKPIGQLLIEEELISPKELEEALAIQRTRGGKIVSVLIGLGYFDLKTFMGFLSKRRGIASVDLSAYEIPREVVALIPKDFAVHHEVFPLDRMGKSLTVCMACPLDAATVHKMEEMTGLRIWPVLSEPADIKTAIKEYYRNGGQPGEADKTEAALSEEERLQQAEGTLRAACIVSLIKQIVSLPPLPETVLYVQSAMHDASKSLVQVASRVSMDPAIAAQLLRLVNSAALGLSRRIANVNMACSLLGLRSIYDLVLAAAATKYFEQWDGVNYKIFWENALLCAASATEIARRCGAEKNDRIFSAALLHDIGRLVFTVVTPKAYAKLMGATDSVLLLQEERELLQMSHTEAGYILARTWGLPDFLADATRFHHHPWLAPDTGRDIAIVALAASLFTEDYLDLESESGINRNWISVFDTLHLSLDDLAIIRDRAFVTFHETSPGFFPKA